MTSLELTCQTPAATTAMMNRNDQEAGMARAGKRGGWRRVGAGVMILGASLALSGCISVAAPEKPIVIELNINIKQEVIYRLAADAAKAIETNKEIF